VIRIDTPLQITKDILEFLINRRIMLQTMQMHGIGGGEAILIIYCLVEKDRLKHLQRGLEKMNGILSVELLESRISNMVKL
jgi:transcriptional regulator of aromatic amino acid metabolism